LEVQRRPVDLVFEKDMKRSHFIAKTLIRNAEITREKIADYIEGDADRLEELGNQLHTLLENIDDQKHYREALEVALGHKVGVSSLKTLVEHTEAKATKAEEEEEQQLDTLKQAKKDLKSDKKKLEQKKELLAKATAALEKRKKKIEKAEKQKKDGRKRYGKANKVVVIEDDSETTKREKEITCLNEAIDFVNASPDALTTEKIMDRIAILIERTSPKNKDAKNKDAKMVPVDCDDDEEIVFDNEDEDIFDC